MARFANGPIAFATSTCEAPPHERESVSKSKLEPSSVSSKRPESARFLQYGSSSNVTPSASSTSARICTKRSCAATRRSLKGSASLRPSVRISCFVSVPGRSRSSLE